MIQTQDEQIPTMWERLDSYAKLCIEIRNTHERLVRMDSRALSPSAPVIANAPSGVMADKMGWRLSMREEVEAELDALLADRRCQYTQLESLVKRLDCPHEKQVIRLHFFDGMTWTEAAEVMFGHMGDIEENPERYIRRVHRVCERAIAHMEDLEVDGKGGNL